MKIPIVKAIDKDTGREVEGFYNLTGKTPNL